MLSSLVLVLVLVLGGVLALLVGFFVVIVGVSVPLLSLVLAWGWDVNAWLAEFGDVVLPKRFI